MYIFSQFFCFTYKNLAVKKPNEHRSNDRNTHIHSQRDRQTEVAYVRSKCTAVGNETNTILTIVGTITPLNAS